MAKRFTDSEKWKKPFIRLLPIEYKIFWLYILDDCDHAGVWHVDMEVSEIKLGVKLSQEKARGLFAEKVVEFDSGTKWFIPDFITFQYGELTPKNKMYKPVSAIIEKYSLMGHLSPIYGGQVQDRVKVMVKDEGGTGETFWQNEAERKRPLSECRAIAMNDEGWVRVNKPTDQELNAFDEYLEGTGEPEKTMIDYKKHFHNLKKKSPEKLEKTAKRMVL